MELPIHLRDYQKQLLEEVDVKLFAQHIKRVERQQEAFLEECAKEHNLERGRITVASTPSGEPSFYEEGSKQPQWTDAEWLNVTEQLAPRHTWRIGELVHVDAEGFDPQLLYVIVGIVKHFLVVAEKMVPTRMGRRVPIDCVRHIKPLQPLGIIIDEV